MKTKIIYEDRDVLVCYKPAGLATQTARVGQPDMVSELKNYLAGKEREKFQPPYLGVIHRLDQPVEGLLVFAKQKKAAAKLTAQLSDGTLNKHYLAVTCGQPTDQSGKLVDYLDKDGSAGFALVVTGREKEFPQAKKAVLQYRRVSSTMLPASTSILLSLLDIHIDTGRFHQIRAQMAHAGMPLLGDEKYADQVTKNLSRTLGVRNVALCACEIVFSHPVTGQQMVFEVKPEGAIFRRISS